MNRIDPPQEQQDTGKNTLGDLNAIDVDVKKIPHRTVLTPGLEVMKTRDDVEETDILRMVMIPPLMDPRTVEMIAAAEDVVLMTLLKTNLLMIAEEDAEEALMIPLQKTPLMTVQEAIIEDDAVTEDIAVMKDDIEQSDMAVSQP
jgi:hypothetical protein